jgi:hypothetical protein
VGKKSAQAHTFSRRLSRELDRLCAKSGKAIRPSFPLIRKLLSGNLFAMKASKHRRVQPASQEAQ